MKVSVNQNPTYPEGFSVSFPYSVEDVDRIRLCLGFTWNKTRKAWESSGPEVLLDLQRFNIGIEGMSPGALQVAEDFRNQLWRSMEIRAQPVDDVMYGYQSYGSQFLATMPNSILADDMGTGKSKQALDACILVNANFILILCPKTLCYNWKREVELWHSEYTAGVVPDTVNDNKFGIGRKTFWANPPQIVIANYEKLRISDWPYEMEWDVLIPDEATKLKNNQTQVYKNVRRLIRRTKHTWALTGTPLEIRLPELYSILTLLRPAVLGGYMRFENQHCITDWAGTVIGAKNLDLLRERIGPFMLRRTKAEVLPQLPEKLPPINSFVKLSMPEQAAYQAMTAEFNNWLDEQGVSGGGDPLVQTLRMRQFCCTPDLFTEELGKGSKFEALLELLDEIDGKVVVFCFFEEVISRLHSWLGCHPRATITGKVPHEDRIPRAEDFSAGKLGKVFVSTDAGGMGINITGANTIIHYDQLFNPQKMHQREDRLHRIGQTERVQVINMLCIDTIDYGMLELNIERGHLFTEVVDGAEEAMLRKLDAPRLRRLVEGRLNK